MLFVFSVLALYVVVAEELLLQADNLTGPHPTSCSAHQVLPTISILGWLDLAAAVLAIVPFICGRSALAWYARGTSMPMRIVAQIVVTCAIVVAGLMFPERLVGAELPINRLSSGSCSLELAAGVGKSWKAPFRHPQAILIHSRS